MIGVYAVQSELGELAMDATFDDSSTFDSGYPLSFASGKVLNLPVFTSG